MSDETKANSSPNDQCPEWASVMISQLRQVEIFLGNIPKALAWESSHLEDISKRAFSDEEAIWTEEKAELIFAQIVKKLSSEHYSAEQIVSFFNNRIGYKGGPQYCGPEDLADHL